MILKESEIDQDTINEVLGKPYKEPGKWFTVNGSSYYFIKELKNSKDEEVLKWEDSKGIFQRHEKGLALYVNRSNYQRVVLISFDSFKTFKLDLRKSEFSQETVLEFETELYRGCFTTNFFAYSSQAKFFSKMGLIED
jgi:hypothetical protein